MINGNWSKLMIMMLVLPGLMYTTCGKTPVTPNGYRSFSSLPPGQQTKEFGSYPISKQVDYFIFEHDHPTDPQGTLAALRDFVSKMKTPSVKESSPAMRGFI